MKAIITSRKLEPRRIGAIVSPGGFTTSISPNAQFSKNQVYDSEVVCFCDIPVEDFDLHMRKYSRFGLSFLKVFLIANEANPVFYIARDAVDRYPSFHHGQPDATLPIKRGQSFDAFFELYTNVFNELFHWVSINGPGREQLPAKLVKILDDAMLLKSFLNHLFPYFKFFGAKLSEASASNFYMEREWRVRGALEFQLEDVHRVILPATYAHRFRNDFPEYFGQVTFSDS